MLQIYNLRAPMTYCRADIKRYFGSITSMENAVIIVLSHDTLKIFAIRKTFKHNADTHTHTNFTSTILC